MIGLMKLAWRNFSRHLYRYRVLLFALILVSAALVMVIGSVSGMHEALRGKAGRYFSGTVSVHGYTSNRRSLIEDPDHLEEVFRSLPVPIVTWSRRSLYYDMDARLFASGFQMQQRRVVGIEWDLEREVISGFDFVEGSAPEADDDNALLISTAVAQNLQVRAGDEVIVSVTTGRGQVNTVPLIVHGIFAESSFFGYTSYMERRTLNRLMAVAEDSVNEMGVFLPPGSDQKLVADLILQELEGRYDVMPFIETRDQRDAQLAGDWSGRRYAAMSLSAHLAEITDLLAAMTIIAGVVLLLFLSIVVIGVSNTYSMIVHERQTEIGTLRALGLRQGSTVLLFLMESACMGFFGLLGGSLLGFTLLQAVSKLLDFSAYNWAQLFMIQGRLYWHVPCSLLLAVMAAALVSVILGCVRSAWAAGRIAPVDALREAG
ncbi:ABC transporter permease [Spirochaeta dissipatitropha]